MFKCSIFDFKFKFNFKLLHCSIVKFLVFNLNLIFKFSKFYFIITENQQQKTQPSKFYLWKTVQNLPTKPNGRILKVCYIIILYKWSCLSVGPPCLAVGATVCLSLCWSVRLSVCSQWISRSIIVVYSDLSLTF